MVEDNPWLEWFVYGAVFLVILLIVLGRSGLRRLASTLSDLRRMEIRMPSAYPLELSCSPVSLRLLQAHDAEDGWTLSLEEGSIWILFERGAPGAEVEGLAGAHRAVLGADDPEAGGRFYELLMRWMAVEPPPFAHPERLEERDESIELRPRELEFLEVTPGREPFRAALSFADIDRAELLLEIDAEGGRAELQRGGPPGGQRAAAVAISEAIAFGPAPRRDSERVPFPRRPEPLLAPSKPIDLPAELSGTPAPFGGGLLALHREGDRAKLYRWETPEDEPRALHDFEGNAHLLGVTPDGLSAAFVAYPRMPVEGEGPTRIFTLDADDEAPRALVTFDHDTHVGVWSAATSPDGARLAMTLAREVETGSGAELSHALEIYSLDDGTYLEHIPLESRIETIVWDAAGIFLGRDSAGPPGEAHDVFWRVDIDDEETRLERARHPGFASPDGRHELRGMDYGFVVDDAEGEEVRFEACDADEVLALDQFFATGPRWVGPHHLLLELPRRPALVDLAEREVRPLFDPSDRELEVARITSPPDGIVARAPRVADEPVAYRWVGARLETQ